MMFLKRIVDDKTDMIMSVSRFWNTFGYMCYSQFNLLWILLKGWRYPQQNGYYMVVQEYVKLVYDKTPEMINF